MWGGGFDRERLLFPVGDPGFPTMGNPAGPRGIPYRLTLGDLEIRAFYGPGFPLFPETEVIILQKEGTFQAV